jgi:integrase
VSYIVYYRTAEGRQRIYTLGKHGSPWTPDSARKEAKRILGLVASGGDPAEDKKSKRHAEKTAKRASTCKKRGLSNVRGGKGAASRTVGLLGAIFTYAMRRGMRSGIPIRGVERFADGQRLRRLTDEEYLKIGTAHARAASGNEWPPLVAAAQLLIVTGWRTGEVIGLRWDEIDLTRRTAVLGDTKTGQSVRPLSRTACDILRAQNTKQGLVFPAARGLGHMNGFAKVWSRLIRLEGVPAEVTPHVLRHSFASLAHDLGYSEPTIASLLGHKGRSVTSRYIHAADVVLLAAADAVANRTSSMMGMSSTSEVMEFRPAVRAA